MTVLAFSYTQVLWVMLYDVAFEMVYGTVAINIYILSMNTLDIHIVKANYDFN